MILELRKSFAVESVITRGRGGSIHLNRESICHWRNNLTTCESARSLRVGAVSKDFLWGKTWWFMGSYKGSIKCLIGACHKLVLLLRYDHLPLHKPTGSDPLFTSSCKYLHANGLCNVENDPQARDSYSLRTKYGYCEPWVSNFFSGLKSFAASRRPYGKPVTIKIRIKRRLPKYEN